MEEKSPSCPQCSLSLQTCDAILGPVPLLNRGLTDLTESLNKGEAKDLKAVISRFEQAFPSSQLNIVLRDFNIDFNLPTQLFWLFNKSGLSPIDHKGAKNQDFLIGLDPSTGRLALTVGYGLEPFFKTDTIAELLESARPLLEKGKIAVALKQLIGELSQTLPRLAREAQATPN